MKIMAMQNLTRKRSVSGNVAVLPPQNSKQLLDLICLICVALHFNSSDGDHDRNVQDL